MRTYDSDMQEHIEQTTTSLTTCIWLEQQDPGTQVLTVTAFNRPLTIDGDVYSSFGFLRQDTTTNDDMQIGTTEAVGILDSAAITEDDLRAGKWDFAAYKLFQVNWQDLSMGRIQLQEGNLGIVRAGAIKFTAELLSITQAVQNSIGNLNSPACIHKFAASEGGPGLGNGCTVDPALHTVTGTVDSVDSDLYGVHDAARVETDNFFTNGIFRLTSGTRSGMEWEVRAYTPGFWVLFTGLPEDATGETYEMVRGCDKSLRMCVDDYDNILDRLASDYTQGGDIAVQVARHNG